MDQLKSADIHKALQVVGIHDRNASHKQRWKDHLKRLSDRIPKQIWKYRN